MEAPSDLLAPLALDTAAALVPATRDALWRDADGTSERLRFPAAAARLRRAGPVLVCHRRALARRLAMPELRALDLLELFAFVHPARFVLPTPKGLAAALDLPAPETLAAAAATLPAIAQCLLAALSDRDYPDAEAASSTARAMAAGGWNWAPPVLAALEDQADASAGARAMSGLDAWTRLPEWPELAPEPPPGSEPVDPAQARDRLAALVGALAEDRPQQADYASAVSAAFAPRDAADVPRVVLAEAGTGVGKTLGYVAPASVWAEKNGGAVWISTFTRNLQHQVDQELSHLFPDDDEKARKTVVRKGRENYLCLLNYQEAASAARLRSTDAVPLGLMARWLSRSRDGSLIGSDFPGWLADIVGPGRVQALTDHRGECIYSACEHYKRCFIEHGIRKARRAQMVVANHALVMVQAALGGDEAHLPQRYVFDEGHHVFEAADSAFSGHLTGREAAELRHWLRGAERARRSRARGLRTRVEDLLPQDRRAVEALDAVLKAALALPTAGWLERIAAERPEGPAERFLALVRRQVYARGRGTDGPYGVETETRPPVPDLIDAAAALDAALDRLARPMLALRRLLLARLADEAEHLDKPQRVRIEAAARSLTRRGEVQINGWRSMLQALEAETPPEFVDWFAVDRAFGKDVDVGMHRHWVDPTQPFAEHVVTRAHGVVVTSATLRDATGDDETDWRAAEARCGARHLPEPALRVAVRSPFDYGALTRVFVVTDVRKDDPEQVAAAYRALFGAAGGGGLGLFTAIARLRAVHGRIAGPLEDAGIPLLAQHVDAVDNATLVDIFRAEPASCLLGTDAVRDGVDVPGESLRLIVFDRVPWPRRTILHRARMAAFGGRAYDDMLARLRIKQAYGRLVRRADDRGVFVLLDPMMPSRLLTAFPEGVEVARIGLAEAVKATRDHLTAARRH